ncbi:hypothetical protein [Pseudomonas caricapapayae]|uniref:hypothetical protein n=1 Tax=Pseudomonas caricapapayae TaxID=46678 RepID=UPI0011C35D55|nr:hypothetical protein [Pseudomonas caricapapayae]
MNNDNKSKNAHTVIEIEDVRYITPSRINQKEIKRCSREFNCDSKSFMLFKRERNPKISDYEIISCHFLSDEKIDLHLDKIGIGSRVNTIGHSKWIFNRSSEINELYLTENFSQFFSHVVDYDTQAIFDIEGYTEERRDNLLYKAPLKTEHRVYCSDVLEETKQYYNRLKNPRVELIGDTGYLDDMKILISNEQNANIYRGIHSTKKPHLILAIHEADEERVKYLIHLDTLTCKIIGVYNHTLNKDRRNFFAVFDAEDKAFRNNNDIIAVSNK